MDPLVWILVPGLSAVASAVLAWFVMQSRMEVKLAEERERLIEDIGDIKLMSGAWRASVDPEDGSLRFYCD